VASETTIAPGAAAPGTSQGSGHVGDHDAASVDVEALADRVYKIMLGEVHLELARARGGARPGRG
jgi:hypothetical protein